MEALALALHCDSRAEAVICGIEETSSFFLYPKQYTWSLNFYENLEKIIEKL